MTSDYPDWQRAFRIVGTEITIPINITASAVTIPVAIQSSAVTINVRFVSQAVTLWVGITASVITLDVNIESQTANINFTFADQSVAVFDAAKWFAHTAAQKYIVGSGGVPPGVFTVLASRTVPSGATFFITGMSFGVDGGSGMTVAIADLRIDAVSLMYVGWLPSGALIFDVPIRATANQVVDMRIKNVGGAAGSVAYGGFWGYDEV
jgi:hypothetical protein